MFFSRPAQMQNSCGSEEPYACVCVRACACARAHVCVKMRMRVRVHVAPYDTSYVFPYFFPQSQAAIMMMSMSSHIIQALFSKARHIIKPFLLEFATLPYKHLAPWHMPSPWKPYV
jgi:hypothetical protein